MINFAQAFITWDAEVMKQAGLNTILGIGIVFCVLVFISLLIYCLKFVNKDLRKKPEVKADAPTAPVSEPEYEDVTDDLEIVAVITAAITAYEESMGGYVPEDGLVVRSIRKVNKKRWLNA